MSITKGFTLIELLIVIGILAILATTVVLVLNPAQILQETRDTQRISDLSSVQSAVGLYLATAAAIDMDDAFATAYAAGSGTGCGGDWWASITSVPSTSKPFVNPTVIEASQGLTTPRDVDGDGWAPIDLTAVSGGSPLSGLPQDPSSTAGGATNPLDNGTPPLGRFYAYQCVNSSQTYSGVTGPAYEINGNMESGKFDSNTTCTVVGSDAQGVECTDGGNNNQVYEVGNAPGLAL